MKIILFRDGQTGVKASLPGEYPEVELSDLLGGETEMKPITKRLTLVTLKDAEALGIPQKYILRRLGYADKPIAGDCAVVAARASGVLTDIEARDVALVRSVIIPAEAYEARRSC